MLTEIWVTCLHGDGDGRSEVALSHVKNVMRAIQNFHHQEVIDLGRQGSLIDTKNLGRVEDNTFL